MISFIPIALWARVYKLIESFEIIHSLTTNRKKHDISENIRSANENAGFVLLRNFSDWFQL